jgi:hypothetical protein
MALNDIGTNPDGTAGPERVGCADGLPGLAGAATIVCVTTGVAAGGWAAGERPAPAQPASRADAGSAKAHQAKTARDAASQPIIAVGGRRIPSRMTS